MHRLPPVEGEWIDRARPLAFRFEGRPAQGFAGDTISSALLAGGAPYLARSFKLHRPRSVWGAADIDVNVLMQIGQRLNVRADVEPLADGLDVWPVNVGAGGLHGDRLAILDRFSKAFPAGFYYKAFHSKRWFPTWERLIRRTTGLGVLDLATPRVATPKRYDSCDVLVVGGGASGLRAALAAAAEGAQVLLVEQAPRLGGRSFDARHGGIGRAALQDLLAQVAAEPRIRTWTGAFAAGWYADRWVPVAHRDHIVKVRCGAMVCAQGAWEQPAVFRHNDLPGVVAAGAALRLAHRHAVAVGRRVVVLTANADGYGAALDLHALGVVVQAVVDLRDGPGPQSEPLQQAAAAAGLRVISSRAVCEAHAGSSTLSAVTLTAGPAGPGQAAPGERIDCDALLISTGFAPAMPLLYQAGARVRWDDGIGQFVPSELPRGVEACGRAAGCYSPDDAAERASAAGARAAAHAAGRALPPIPARSVAVECPSHPWPVVEHPQGKEFVDFDEDLQVKDFRVSVQEGFDNIELLKRFTTVGMGPSQGKHSHMNALRLLARLTGRTPEQVGTTTARPMFHPVPMSHLGGRRFHPHRRTPLDGLLAAAGAVWMPAGPWRRPAWFARPGLARADCIAAEVAAVHERCGLIDVGTLGKIELRGAQAGELLERLYTGRFAAMKTGTTRYALALDEAGVIIDDGVVACLGPGHYYVSTTTSAAPMVYREMQRWNAVWRLDATLANLTGHMAAVSLAGPAAPTVLARVLALPPGELPYLAVRDTAFRDGLGLDGVPARCLRVGFVGEWGVEIHVPASAGPALWHALTAAGADAGMVPFGVEAQRVLRLEKGHVIVGQDTDGLTTPLDAGMGWALKMDKAFFVGQRSLRIVERQARRQVLVGWRLPANAPCPEECHLIIHDGDIAGRVTSVTRSAAVGAIIGLAYVAPELAADGTPITIRLTGPSPDVAPTVVATVCATPFFDPEGRRMRDASIGPAASAVAVGDAPRLPTAGVADPLTLVGAATDAEGVRWTQVQPVRRGARVTRLAGSRVGFKGPAALQLTEAIAIASVDSPAAGTVATLPQPNHRAAVGGGIELLRLGMSEFIVEPATAAAEGTQAAEAALLAPWCKAIEAAAGSGVHPVLHQDAALLLHGPRVRDLLRQACAVDLAAPDWPDDAVVMTQVIGVSVVATRCQVHGARAVRLLFDPTWLDHMHDALARIAAELTPDDPEEAPDEP